jgi:hypothetical protein
MLKISSSNSDHYAINGRRLVGNTLLKGDEEGMYYLGEEI